jgi:hypothetical protein
MTRRTAAGRTSLPLSSTLAVYVPINVTIVILIRRCKDSKNFPLCSTSLQNFPQNVNFFHFGVGRGRFFEGVANIVRLQIVSSGNEFDKNVPVWQEKLDSGNEFGKNVPVWLEKLDFGNEFGKNVPV